MECKTTHLLWSVLLTVGQYWCGEKIWVTWNGNALFYESCITTH